MEWKPCSITEGREKKKKEVKSLEERWIEGLANVEEEEWQEVLFTVDSGAMDTVVGEEECPQFQRSKSPGSRNGLMYEVANGETVPNKGQKHIRGLTEEEVPISIVAQVCSITKPLLSVKKMCNAGNTVVFDNEGCYIQCKATGRCTAISDQGGTFRCRIGCETRVFKGRAARSERE